MPYSVRKKGSKWEVMNSDTGESKGMSESKEMAMDHMRKLYMVEKEGPEDIRSKMMRKKVKGSK